VAGCCECGDEPSSSCATELVLSEGCLYSSGRLAMYMHFYHGLLCTCTSVYSHGSLGIRSYFRLRNIKPYTI
jgi:hypothetical protein